MDTLLTTVVNDFPTREAKAELFVDLVGPLRLRDAAGADLTPNGRKSQGVLALIAVSPGLRRSRAWLQDKLWSDRPPVQGSASLRQCLSEIRTSLGAQVGCLKTDRGWVALDPQRVHVIADSERAGAGEVEFLEGLDIRDAEFEHWIRDQRMQHAERQSRENEARPAPALVELPAPARAQPTVGLTALPQRGETEQAYADVMLSLVARGLLSNAAVGVLDLRDLPDPVPAKAAQGADCLLRIASSAWGSRARVTATLTDARANRLHWADTATFEVAEFYAEDSAEIGAFTARVARVVQAWATRAEAGGGVDRKAVTPFPRLVRPSIADLRSAALPTALAQ